MFGVKHERRHPKCGSSKSLPSGPSAADGYADPFPELQDTSSGSTKNLIIMEQLLSEIIADIGESQEAYLFRVALPCVRTDFCELKCEIKSNGKVHIQGRITGFPYARPTTVAGRTIFFCLVQAEGPCRSDYFLHGMDTGKNMTSGKKPVGASFDDQLFLLNFIMCSYLGPDVYSDELRCSWFERFAKSSPQYALGNLGRSFLRVSHLLRLYCYVLRNANNDLVLEPNMFYMYLNGDLPLPSSGSVDDH